MKKRVVSVLILLLIMIPLVVLSRVTRIIFFCFAGLLCAYEMCNRLTNAGYVCSLVADAFLLISVAAMLIAGRELSANGQFLRVFVLFVAVTYGTFILSVLLKKPTGKDMMGTLSTLLYPGLPFTVLMFIVGSEIWAEALTMACVSTWICDSFALFVGKRFGKHKIAPAISPNKTVEGCVGGAVFAILSGVLSWFLIGLYAKGFHASLYGGILRHTLSLPVCCLIALLASTLGQIGDLTESLVKRSLDIKDFSDLIPGHGGMMDRADSLMFSIPASYLMIMLFSNL